MQQVDSEDANFLFMEKAESPTHISLIYLYDQSGLGKQQVRFTHIREHVKNRLNSAPVFQQKIMRTPADIDYPYWVNDEKFDLDFHVRHLALPQPGDWRQFCIQASRLHSRPLDMSRPLWELYVIEGLHNVTGMPRNSFAIYFKVHHCAMDEFTAQELFQSAHAQTPNPRQHESSAQHIAHVPRRTPQPMEMVVRGLLNNSVRSVRLALQSVSNFRTLSKILTRLSIRVAQDMAQDDAAGEKPSRFAQRLSSARVFEGAFYPREIFDNYLRKVPGATLTHAVLAICGEAMRRYLERHGESSNASLQALLEVNVRNAGAHALIGNRIAINQIELHTPVSYPVGRLQAIYTANRELQSIENSELTSFRLRSLYENLPAPLLAWLGRLSNQKNSPNRAVMSGGSLGLAELKGSERPLYLLGARVHGFTSISPLYSGCGLMFCASTYADTVGLTFTSDRLMMPDPETMRECLDEAVAVVAKLKAGKPARPGQPAKKRKLTKSKKAAKAAPGRTGKTLAA
ncbi:MAG: WS/DGAT domain-containing protein [Gammaproteobacteria bacterium]|nr:WS/DGAT domain-containing protein [Gammaproteobacteria bacterium]